MTKTKKWYQSSTIWGIIIAFIGFAAHQYFGVDTSAVNVPANADFDQLKQIVDQVSASKGNLTSIITDVVSAFGFIMGMIGRLTAKSQITGKTPAVTQPPSPTI